ncbi:MAG: hypothetical protein OEY96_12930 [Gammaproteobacteria bacterium]|nr:hypothetical protein [Gammaproteobacteria bacterium]
MKTENDMNELLQYHSQPESERFVASVNKAIKKGSKQRKFILLSAFLFALVTFLILIPSAFTGFEQPDFSWLMAVANFSIVDFSVESFSLTESISPYWIAAGFVVTTGISGWFFAEEI